MITNSFYTYVIYTYKCDSLQWTGPEGYHAVVGYNIQGLPVRNEPRSGTGAINTIDCDNRPLSEYRNIVYSFEGNRGKRTFTLLKENMHFTYNNCCSLKILICYKRDVFEYVSFIMNNTF